MTKKIGLTAVCPFCKAVSFVTVDYDQYRDWLDGELIQNAMPNLSAVDREILISGICVECQKSIFDDEEI